MAFSVILHPPPIILSVRPLSVTFANNLENVMRSEEPRHKIFILWRGALLHMFIHRFPKTALKNIQNSPLYSILKLTFPEIFKNKNFRFSQFSQNFVWKKCPFYGTLGFLTCFSLDRKKCPFYGTLGFLTCFSLDPRTPKTISLYSILKLTFPDVFKNESFRFSQYSQEIFFRLMPGFHRWPDKLLTHFQISW